MKKLVSVLLALVMLLSLTSSAMAATTLKLALTQGDVGREESAEIMWVELFEEYVEANSDIEVDIYPSLQLGTAAENVQSVVANSVEMACVNMSMLNTIYPESMVLSCPGMFASEEECDKILAGEWGQAFFADMAEKTNVKMLTAISNGFRCFTTNKAPLNTVESAKGNVWRVMDSPVYIKMVEALGAKAVPMAGSEMYTAMQNGTIDGQENPVINILNDKTYEVQKYMVMDKHVASIVTFFISNAVFNSLSAEEQQVILDAAAYATPEAQRVIKSLNDAGMQKLRDFGLEIYEPTAEELAGWHNAITAPCQEYVRAELGDAVVDGLTAAVAAAR